MKKNLQYFLFATIIIIGGCNSNKDSNKFAVNECWNLEKVLFWQITPEIIDQYRPFSQIGTIDVPLHRVWFKGDKKVYIGLTQNVDLTDLISNLKERGIQQERKVKANDKMIYEFLTRKGLYISLFKKDEPECIIVITTTSKSNEDLFNDRTFIINHLTCE